LRTVSWIAGRAVWNEGEVRSSVAVNFIFVFYFICSLWRSSFLLLFLKHTDISNIQSAGRKKKGHRRILLGFVVFSHKFTFYIIFLLRLRFLPYGIELEEGNTSR
jgi:hypothetical protein